MPPSGDERAPEQTGEPSNESDPNQENSELMQINFDEAPSVDDLAATSTNSQLKVQFLKLGGIIRLQGFWEFVPYNDDPAKDIPDEFREAVQSARDKLVQSASQNERENALKELKELYQKQFGKGSEERNVISLFLFAGPVYAAWNKFRYIKFNCYQQYLDSDHSRRQNHYCDYDLIPTRSLKLSILYTGDGYIDNYERLVRLTKFFGHNRVKRVAVMQVMHHGSETNWHKGVAATFKPLFSVFSSDPDRKRLEHPHGAVLRDFWSYGPLQVDKLKNARIQGCLL